MKCRISTIETEDKKIALVTFDKDNKPQIPVKDKWIKTDEENK